jgi:serine/threonine-protein kinase HipA
MWMAKQGRPQNSMNPVEKLCFIGSRGMGALEFETAIFPQHKNTFSVEIESRYDTLYYI